MSVAFGRLYASSFWTNPPEESLALLLEQNQKSTQVLDKLTQFYKDISELELDHSRKIQATIRKHGIDKLHILNNASLLQLDGVVDGITKLAAVHQDFSMKVEEKLYAPMKDIVSQRKYQGKDIERSLRTAWRELSDLKAKCDKKTSKYKEIWNKLSAIKLEMMTMDAIETQRFNEKVKNLKKEMIAVRSESWELVKQYNTKADEWSQQWWDSCNELQQMEETKFKSLKTNLWDFANEISTVCVEQDQLAEHMRVCLQTTSLTKEMKHYVSTNTTGQDMIPKLQFVDYAKGEKEEQFTSCRKFDLQEIPVINETSSTVKSKLEKLKVPPPVITEVQDAEFNYISKSKETFKELQEQTQMEIAKNRLTVSTVHSKTNSDPSTYNKVMSEYSNGTEGTSVLSGGDNNDLSYELNDEDNFNTPRQVSNFTNAEGKMRSSMFTTSAMSPTKLHKFDELVKKTSKASSRKVSSSTLLKKSKSSTTFTNLTANNLPSHSTEGFPVIGYAKAQYGYEACIPEELSFKKKETLLILHKQPDGWWFAENYSTGDSGLAPSNYLVEL